MKKSLQKCWNALIGWSISKLLEKHVVKLALRLKNSEYEKVIHNQSLMIRSQHQLIVDADIKIKSLQMARRAINKDNVPDALMHDLNAAMNQSDTINDQVDRLLEMERIREELKKLGCTF